MSKDPGRRLNADQARAALQAVQREHDMAQVQTSWIYAPPPTQVVRAPPGKPQSRKRRW